MSPERKADGTEFAIADLRAVTSQIYHTCRIKRYRPTLRSIVAYGSGKFVSATTERIDALENYITQLVSMGYVEHRDGAYYLTVNGEHFNNPNKDIPAQFSCSDVRSRGRRMTRADRLTAIALGKLPRPR